jgi:nitrogen fixation-related uncharacterized protein
VDVIIALVFISIVLVIGGLVFFFSRMSQGDFEHGDRLSLLPLDDDEKVVRKDDAFFADKSNSAPHISNDNDESIAPDPKAEG